MKIMSLFDWRIGRIENTKPKDHVDCPECDGEGIIFDVCDCCNHEREIECETCFGAGYLPFGKLTGSQRENCFPRADYEVAVKDDLRGVAHWTGRSLSDVCLEFGYKVYSKILNQEECIAKV